VEHFGLTHLSAGELLREEVTKKSGRAALIAEFIKDGKIVPQVQWRSQGWGGGDRPPQSPQKPFSQKG
jgi:hypothetical protein